MARHEIFEGGSVTMELFGAVAIGGLCLVGALAITLIALPQIIEDWRRMKERELARKESRER